MRSVYDDMKLACLSLFLSSSSVLYLLSEPHWTITSKAPATGGLKRNATLIMESLVSFPCFWQKPNEGCCLHCFLELLQICFRPRRCYGFIVFRNIHHTGLLLKHEKKDSICTVGKNTPIVRWCTYCTAFSDFPAYLKKKVLAVLL